MALKRLMALLLLVTFWGIFSVWPCNLDNCLRRDDHISIVDEGYYGLLNKEPEQCDKMTSGELKDKTDSWEFKIDHCIISFNTSNAPEDWNNLSFWVQKMNNSYILFMSKTLVKRVPCTLKLCVILGECNATLLHQPKHNWAGESDVTGNCRTTCLNPNICRKTVYKKTTCRNFFPNQETKNKYIVNVTESPENCYNCDNPVKTPEEEITPTLQFGTEDGGDIDPVQASNAMKDISSLISQMKKSSASVDMGAVTGVLVTYKEIADISEVSFGYASFNSTMNIVENRDELSRFSRSVSVSKEAFERAYHLSNGTAFAGVFRVPNMAKDLKNSTVLNNELVAIEMGAVIANLTDKINIRYKNIKKEWGTPSCHSWDGEGNRPNWTADGCLTFIQGHEIQCQCTHLTFFAVLMIPPNITISSTDLSNLTYITSVGCGLSIFFQIVVLFMHYLLRKTKANKATQILMQLFLAMFLLNLTFLTNEYVADLRSNVGCQIMAAIMHYSMLTTFTWFALVAFHLCLQIYMIGNITIHRYILKVCIGGWVLPSVVVVTIFSLGKYGEQFIQASGGKEVIMCWIKDTDVHYIVNIGFYALVFLFTFTTLIVVLRWMVYLNGTTAGSAQLGTGTKKIFMVLGLCCLLGITWSFAFFAHGPMLVPSYYVFTVLNSFQGFFLFIYYCNTSGLIGKTKDYNCSEKSSIVNTYLDTFYLYANFTTSGQNL